jgi:hypothetical protein
MHLHGLGKTDRLAGESFHPGPQGQMFALDLLRVPRARVGLLGLDVSRVRAPMIRLRAGDAKRLQQGVELYKPLGLATPTPVGHDLATMGIDHMPPPARGFFPLHAGPHCIPFRFLSHPQDHLHLLWSHQGA